MTDFNKLRELYAQKSFTVLASYLRERILEYQHEGPAIYSVSQDYSPEIWYSSHSCATQTSYYKLNHHLCKHAVDLCNKPITQAVPGALFKYVGAWDEFRRISEVTTFQWLVYEPDLVEAHMITQTQAYKTWKLLRETMFAERESLPSMLWVSESPLSANSILLGKNLYDKRQSGLMYAEKLELLCIVLNVCRLAMVKWMQEILSRPDNQLNWLWLREQFAEAHVTLWQLVNLVLGSRAESVVARILKYLREDEGQGFRLDAIGCCCPSLESGSGQVQKDDLGLDGLKAGEE
ncbi:hypothetical protein BJ508DRAFT_76842 [Ascobolus immersus RN42]|uniref:Uncharacterized protein n=1 Tax=Ascobolus immersus RN42 TaxID=1160509 RepID=A0A3N4HF65_ASCIM|nr:hypothetical protein BJ508DRAFT_76842 [Ascobolus immersus RN42]